MCCLYIIFLANRRIVADGVEQHKRRRSSVVSRSVWKFAYIRDEHSFGLVFRGASYHTCWRLTRLGAEFADSEIKDCSTSIRNGRCTSIHPFDLLQDDPRMQRQAEGSD